MNSTSGSSAAAAPLSPASHQRNSVVDSSIAPTDPYHFNSRNGPVPGSSLPEVRSVKIKEGEEAESEPSIPPVGGAAAVSELSSDPSSEASSEAPSEASSEASNAAARDAEERLNAMISASALAHLRKSAGDSGVLAVAGYYNMPHHPDAAAAAAAGVPLPLSPGDRRNPPPWPPYVNPAGSSPKMSRNTPMMIGGHEAAANGAMQASLARGRGRPRKPTMGLMGGDLPPGPALPSNDVPNVYDAASAKAVDEVLRCLHPFIWSGAAMMKPGPPPGVRAAPYMESGSPGVRAAQNYLESGSPAGNAFGPGRTPTSGASTLHSSPSSVNSTVGSMFTAEGLSDSNAAAARRLTSGLDLADLERSLREDGRYMFNAQLRTHLNNGATKGASGDAVGGSSNRSGKSGREGGGGRRGATEYSCSYPGVSWNTRMQAWLVYFEDAKGRKSRTFNPKRLSAGQLELLPPDIRNKYATDPVTVAMHCACVYAARVRWEGRLRKSLGFQSSRSSHRASTGSNREEHSTRRSSRQDFSPSDNNNTRTDQTTPLTDNDQNSNPDLLRGCNPHEEENRVEKLVNTLHQCLRDAGLKLTRVQVMRALSVAVSYSNNETDPPDTGNGEEDELRMELESKLWCA